MEWSVSASGEAPLWHDTVYFGYRSDDAFFNRNWDGACWGRWAGTGTAAGLVCCLWTLDSSAKAKTKRIDGGSPVASLMPKSVLP